MAFFLATLSVGCGGKSRSLTIVWGSDILSLDPNARFEFATDMYSVNVFEPLLRYDRKLSFSPVLATSWDIADGRTWRFHLRPNVFFHDGSPFGAEDVVFTLERVRNDPRSDLSPYLAGISSVRKVDDLTVEVISDRPAGLLSVLSFVYILPKGLVAKDERAFFAKPVGTGPYRLVSWEKEKSLSLSASSEYWGGPPAFQEATFLHVDDAKDPERGWKLALERRPAMFLSPPRKSFAAHKDDSRFQLVSRPGLTVQYLMCNVEPGGGSALADLKVRRALRASIDSKELIDRAMDGMGFPATQLVTPDVFGYDPSLTSPAYVPGEAERLLREAGHPAGIDLTMSYPEGGSESLPNEIVRQLARSGIRVKKVPMSSAAFFEQVNRCQGDLHLTGWICSTGDASELFEGNFYGKARGQGTGLPGCAYARPELDALVDTAARTLDPEARRDVLQRSMRMVLEELPWVPLVVLYDRYALTSEVAWEPRPDGEIYLPEVRRK